MTRQVPRRSLLPLQIGPLFQEVTSTIPSLWPGTNVFLSDCVATASRTCPQSLWKCSACEFSLFSTVGRTWAKLAGDMLIILDGVKLEKWYLC